MNRMPWPGQDRWNDSQPLPSTLKEMASAMKYEFSIFFIRLTLEIIRVGPTPVFRRYRVTPNEASVRRHLLRRVGHRLRQ